jgi:DNA-binding NarL/FixJ family response regulator
LAIRELPGNGIGGFSRVGNLPSGPRGSGWLLVILDISMPNLQGVETARQIKKKYPGIKILILTMHREREYLYDPISAGAEGYLRKEDAEKELFTAIDSIRRGEGFVSPILRPELEEKHKLLPNS